MNKKNKTTNNKTTATKVPKIDDLEPGKDTKGGGKLAAETSLDKNSKVGPSSNQVSGMDLGSGR